MVSQLVMCADFNCVFGMHAMVIAQGPWQPVGSGTLSGHLGMCQDKAMYLHMLSCKFYTSMHIKHVQYLAVTLVFGSHHQQRP